MKKKTSKRISLDDTDLAILALLQEDASISNADLSERLSLSLTPCWRRRKRMEEAGVIKGYQANLDRRMLGLDILAFVHIRFSTHADHAPDAFEAVIAQLPEVLSCHKITGDADYVLQVLAEDLDSYSDFIEQVLRRQVGIASIQSSLALREIKTSNRIAIPKASRDLNIESVRAIQNRLRTTNDRCIDHLPIQHENAFTGARGFDNALRPVHFFRAGF
ncbi:DNA-binding transcriptional activator DecR [Pseudomonas frederiksbergensis]|uniref:DNA-binding transcriptional activator DecR n=2 Tax=Pseudomonas TaxID=286 RepID=A0A6L5C249_9PSED|nr:DNA-binding transcriptional activator DecR [Pseudomonas frederiksbergensis]